MTRLVTRFDIPWAANNPDYQPIFLFSDAILSLDYGWSINGVGKGFVFGIRVWDWTVFLGVSRL